MSEASEFLNAIAPELPDDERMILCAFPGDPNVAGPGAWRPHPWKPGTALDWPVTHNGYVTVSSFRIAQDDTWRRRSELYAAGRALMIDDVGTKVDPAIVAGITASAVVETSQGNYQYWYFLKEAERDPARFDGIIRAFISGKLLGADPGMAGIARVGRIPGFSNCKEKYGGWLVKMHDLSGMRYSVEELLEMFGLQIMGRQVPLRKLPTEEALERNRNFMAVYKFLEQHGMLKRDEPDLSGWTEIECPWKDNHTDRANNGAAIREPHEDNNFYGAFRCHHSHGAYLGWSNLTEWVNDLAVEELDNANAMEGCDE